MRNFVLASALPSTAIIGLALNLRPVMAGVGPLLDQIGIETSLSFTQASLLTSVPVAMIGLCALFIRPLHAWIGERRGVTLGMACISLACLARLIWPSKAGLITTAVLAGAGVALVQMLLPIFVKRCYRDRAGTILGLYSTGIMGGAAIAAVSAAPAAERLGWAGAMAVWAVPALLALPLWLGASKSARQARQPAYASDQLSLFRQKRAWELLTFFGIGTGAYTLVLAWLPGYYTSLGWTPTEAGYLLGFLTFMEVLAGLLISILASRYRDRRGALLSVLALLIVGLLCLARAPLSLAWLASALLGLGIGALFPLTLILTLDHLDDPLQAGTLAAFVQGGGYLIASLMPLGAGWLRDGQTNFANAWLAMALGCIVLAMMALRFTPSSYSTVATGGHGGRRRMVVDFGYFGKLPGHADFIKGGVHRSLIRELDDWISHAMQLMRISPRWQQAYDATRPLHFALIEPRHRQVILGHIIASCDRSGRRYPFLLATKLESRHLRQMKTALPLVYGRIWRHMATLAVGTDTSIRTLQALAARPPTLDCDTAAFHAVFEEFLLKNTLASADMMLSQAGFNGSLRETLLALDVILHSVQNTSSPCLGRGLLLPLPEDPIQGDLFVAFWMDLLTPFLAKADMKVAIFIARSPHYPALVLDPQGESPQSLLSVLDWELGFDHYVAFDQPESINKKMHINHPSPDCRYKFEVSEIPLKTVVEFFKRTIL